MGLMIPLAALITLILSYQRCRHQVPQPWTLDDEGWSDPSGGWTPFFEQKGSVLRVLGYVGCEIAMVAALVLGSLVAATPWHHGSLTVKEFVSNYNHLLTYASAPNFPVEKLGKDGTWYQTDPSHFAFHVMGVEPPSFQFTEQDGQLTQVSFSIVSAQEAFLYDPPPPTPCAPFTPCWGSGSCCRKELNAPLTMELLETMALDERHLDHRRLGHHLPDGFFRLRGL